MKVEIRDIDEKTVKDIFASCKSCLYWEAPERGEPKVPENKAIEIKRAWFKKTSEKFGIGGKLLYVDSKAAGYAQYAPPHFLENVAEFSRELFPPGPDGILLSCLHIKTEYQGKGLGTKLLQAVLEDLRERDYKIVETYSRDDSPVNSSGPTMLYQENGFRKLKTKKWGEGTFSLMRLDL